MMLERHFRVITVSIAVGALCVSALARGQGVGRKPDAEIEANVLRSLAGAPELSAESISTTTVYGTVTLSGSVQNEVLRQRAEQLAATTPGVQKVVDELALAGGTRTVVPGSGGVLQSDGTYTTAEAASSMQSASSPVYGSQAGTGGQEIPPPNGPDTDAYGHPLMGSTSGAQAGAASQGPYQQPQGDGSQGQQSGGLAPYGPPTQRPAYGGPYGPPPRQGYNQPYGEGPGAGQTGGQGVTLPAGTVVHVRVNEHLSSHDIKDGTPFDAIVASDIVADGQVALPRGAYVQGTVVDAERAGVLKGRGELGLRLTQVTLGGKVYPVTTDVFTAHGGDKTIQTVNSTLGLGALGAIFGAVAGGGAGAAIGAGVGGAVGLGSSAASGRGDVFIPSEAVLSFRLTQPAALTTVSQAEMQRLGYGAPPDGPRGPMMVRRYPYGYPYYGPVYYAPRYYRPYGYYPY